MEGTPLNNAFMVYQDSMRHFRAKIEKIEPKGQNERVIFPGTELERLHNAQGEYMMDFIKQNFTNPLGNVLLMRTLDLYYIPTFNYIVINIKRLDAIFSFVDDKTRNHPRFVSFMQTIKKVQSSSSITKKKVKNFHLITPEGKTKQLLEFVGKKNFTFMIFWILRDEQNLTNISELKEIYREFSNQLEIVSISLESQQVLQSNFSNTQNIPWTQLIATNGFDSDIAKTYNIQNLPFGLLLDKEGMIIANFHTPSILKYFMQDKSLQASKFWLSE